MFSNFKTILEMGSERAVADLVVKAVEDNPESFREVLDISFLEEYPVSMRAARAIQLYCEKYHESIYPYLDEVVDMTIRSQISGVKHNFLKIFTEYLDLGRLSDPGPLLNKCFEWLLDARNTPAVRIYSMGVIFKLGLKEPGLHQELKAIIEIVTEEGGPSIKSYGKKMLRKINNEQG